MTPVKYITAVLANAAGFRQGHEGKFYFDENTLTSNFRGNNIPAPSHWDLHEFIRDKRGVHIEIHRNAGGYYWSMCKSDSGTDLGWIDFPGPNMCGVWETYPEALEQAMQVQLCMDLPKDNSKIKHWGLYVDNAYKAYKKYVKNFKGKDSGNTGS